MAQARTTEQVKFTVTEAIDGTYVRWVARVGRERIADVGQRIVGSTCDSGELTEVIAAHFGVQVEAVKYKRDGKGRALFVPTQGHVDVPVKAAEPVGCGHQPGQDGCELVTCGGVPMQWVPLDRNVVTPDTGREVGVMTAGEAMTGMVARVTGMQVDGLRFADNGWSDMRPGARPLSGWEFTVGQATDGRVARPGAVCHVRVLAYKAKNPMESFDRSYAAVYVGLARVAGAVEMERPYAQWAWEVAQLVAPVVEQLHDACELADARPRDGWRLKSPPLGHLVEHSTGLAVVRDSRVGGCTLVVRDVMGREHFVDREQAGWWTVFPAARDADGDTWARREQRIDWFERLVQQRHQTYEHTDAAGECVPCMGEVLGSADEHGHHWGRYALAPWCFSCGAVASMADDVADTAGEVRRCPGAPRHEFSDEQPAPVQSAPVEAAEPEPQFPVPAQVRDGSPLARWVMGDVGIYNWPQCRYCGRASKTDCAPATCMLCGTVQCAGNGSGNGCCKVCYDGYLPGWSRIGRDVCGGKGCTNPAVATAPRVGQVCVDCAQTTKVRKPAGWMTLAEYAAARVKDRDSGKGSTFMRWRFVDHDQAQPEVDRAAVAAEMAERVGQALMDGDLDTAERMVDAGDEYEPGHQVSGYGSWTAMREEIAERRRERKVNPGAYMPVQREPELEPVGSDPWGPALADMGL